MRRKDGAEELRAAVPEMEGERWAPAQDKGRGPSAQLPAHLFSQAAPNSLQQLLPFLAHPNLTTSDTTGSDLV